MLYEILLRTKCTYPATAAGRQLLRLMPSDGLGGQRLIAGVLDIKPGPAERSDRYDFFGNRTTEVAFTRPVEEVEFVVRARVDKLGSARAGDDSCSFVELPGDISAMQSLDPASPHHFIDISPMVGSSPAVAEFARDAVGSAKTVMEAAHALNTAIYKGMTYDGDATTVDTPLEEAFKMRRGVCQDFSHIMIASLREIGVPAGYVSGFLRTEPPKGKPRLEGADAMHAWVQVWCGLKMGWVEFDPTNNILAGVDHIVAGNGRDYSDVAPVRGVLRTAGGQDISQAVDVIPLG